MKNRVIITVEAAAEKDKTSFKVRTDTDNSSNLFHGNDQRILRMPDAIHIFDH